MRLLLKVLAGVLLGLLGLILAIIVAVNLTNWNSHRDTIADLSQQYLGRTVTVDDHLDISLTRYLTVVAKGLTIDNSSWGEAPNLLSVGDLRFKLDLWSFFWRPVVINIVDIDQVNLSVERNTEGVWNTTFRPDAPTPKPEEDAPPLELALPIIRFLEIQDFRWQLSDELADRNITGTVGRAYIGNDSESTKSKTQLVITGSVGSEPLEVVGDFSESDEMSVEESIVFSIRGGIADASLAANGSVVSPHNSLQLDSSVKVVVPDLPRVASLAQVTVPFHKPIDGRIDVKGKEGIWYVPLVELQVGRSVAFGDAKLDLSKRLPNISFTLNSPYLLIDDFVAPATEEAGEEVVEELTEDDQGAADGEPFSEEPISTAWLKAFEIDGQVQVDEVEGLNEIGKLANDIKMKVSMKDGELVVEPFTMNLAGGRFESSFSVASPHGGSSTKNSSDRGSARNSEAGETGLEATPLAIDFSLNLREVSLQPVMQAVLPAMALEPLQAEKLMGGRLVSDVDLRSRGLSMDQLAANLDGEFQLALQDGYIGSLLVEAIGLDVTESIVSWTTNNPRTDLKCLIARFSVQDGLIKQNAMALATADTNVLGNLSINLGSGELDGRFEAKAHDFSIGSFNTPILLSGTLVKPKIGLETGELVAKGVAAAALGVVLTPVAALVPFIEGGFADSSLCRDYIGSIQTVISESKELDKK